MQGKKFHIGIFASSQSILNRVEVLAAGRQDYIAIKTQALDDAIPLALEMERNGIEVIISRRGTAHLLRENLRIPVLAFPDRSLDILVSLKKASNIGRRILLTVFRQNMGGLAIVEDLLDIRLVQKIYENKASMARGILQAKREGCEVAVGGIVTQHLASDIGLEFVEIRTSKEDIDATIENAKSVAQAGREQKAAARRYRSIIDAASDGIIAVDEKGLISTINATARERLQISEEEAVGEPITRLIPDCGIPQVLMTKRPVNDRLGQIREDHFLFNHLPIIMSGESIGAVSTFRHINHVMRAEHVVRRSLSKGLVSKYTLDELIHVSPTMQDVIDTGRQYAKTESTILIMGETGTGKEIFAHGIHHLSSRTGRPFVSVNCAAIPEQLLESELFGYEEGAFTGSKKGGKPGLFEIAHQGSIFLDEIESTPFPVQLRLLRVLQEREVMRIGANRKIPVDVRIIAAASHDLSISVQQGSFREDLFFRLNVLRIRIPPLRQRKEDIPVLLDFFVSLFSNSHGLDPIGLPESYLNRLMQYPWPGNVRQLRNFAERYVMNCSLGCSTDRLKALYQELIEYPPLKMEIADAAGTSVPLREQVKKIVLSDEKNIIKQALKKARYHKSTAAEQLGISRTTLWRKMKALGLE